MKNIYTKHITVFRYFILWFSPIYLLTLEIEGGVVESYKISVTK